MKVVARTQLGQAQVVPLRPQGPGAVMPHPGAMISGRDPRVDQLIAQLAEVVKVNNALVGEVGALKKELTLLKVLANTTARGASSLAKHFQGLVAASQIQYTPAVVQRAQTPTAASTQQRAAATSAPRASQTVVNAAPAATPAAQNPWEQRDNAFYEGGENDE